MNCKNWLKTGVASAILALTAVGSVNAAHIDELGIGVTLASNDGNGNFVVRYNEYFGADGWMWQGSQWQSNYSTSLSITGAAITGSTSFTLAFEGLVNATASTFYNTPITTRFVNGLTDAAVYSALLSYSITNYDPNATYTIGVTANDCCYVSGSGGPTFANNFTFDPRVVVVDPGEVPEPGSLALVALALGGLAVAGRRQAQKAA